MSKQQPKPDGIALRRKRELRQHEQTIELAQRSFIDLGRALGKIRAEALYIVAGYKTFESYLETRWEISPQHAYRLINAARTALILSPMGYKITSERAARELAPVADDQETLVAVYEEAQRRATDGRVTSTLIAEVRAELAPDAREVVDSYVIEAEVAAATAAFDAKYSGDVGSSLPDVPGESPPADIPTSQVALVAGQPGSNSSDAPVSEGPAGESTANRPGMTSSLARDEVTPPTSGPVGEEPVAPQPVAVPSAGFGVFTAGDEEGRSAGPDLPSDPASELMRAVDGLAAALRDLDYDVAGPMLTDTEFKRFDELVLVLPGSVKLLRRWASAA
jgi:hypothetical protein